MSNPFYLYTIHASIAILTMPTWVWGRTYMINMKNLYSQQKHVMRIICSKERFDHTKLLFQSSKTVNVYILHILNVATFMYRINQKTAPNVFTQDLKIHFIFSKLDSRN